MALNSGEATVQDCIFCKIVRGEVPAEKLYEDDDLIAFDDIHPQAPVHFMLVPKRHIAALAEATAEAAPVLGRMLTLASRLARERGSPDGFRAVINTGRIGRQDVMDVHLHIIGRTDPRGAQRPR